jgi:hypothetical protein
MSASTTTANGTSTIKSTLAAVTLTVPRGEEAGALEQVAQVGAGVARGADGPVGWARGGP